MYHKDLVFIDVETTGVKADKDRIIEVGLRRVHKNRTIAEFSTLLNPQVKFSSFITQLTGITNKSVQSAPLFSEVAEEIQGLLANAVFVAHNAQFDYSFIEAEFSRIGKDFSSPYLCSVKFSRKMYPEYRKHGLDRIIERFAIHVENRHRALDDAIVIHEFFKGTLEQNEPEKFTSTIDELVTIKPQPSQITKRFASNLPERSGVYIFLDKENNPLYVGKSINIKNRVTSHLSNNPNETLIKNIDSIRTIPTAGEMGALIRESHLIKTRYPMFNRLLRHKRSLLILNKQVDDNGYIQLTPKEVEAIDVSDFDNFFGIFRSKKQLENFLIRTARSYNLCHKYLGLEKTKTSCFASQIGICNGACRGKESAAEYNSRVYQAFAQYHVISWPYQGPIIFTESSPDLDEKFLIDNWCLLGSSQSLSEKSDTSFTGKYTFDMDTYHILRRQLRKTKPEAILPIASVSEVGTDFKFI